MILVSVFRFGVYLATLTFTLQDFSSIFCHQLGDGQARSNYILAEALNRMPLVCNLRSRCFMLPTTMTLSTVTQQGNPQKLTASHPKKRRNLFVTGNHTPQSNVESCKSSVTGDIQFLRKRTDRILRITTPPIAHSSSLLDTPINQHEPATTSRTFMSSIPLISSKGMKADRKTFNWLIDAWSTSGEVDAPEKATALLERMEELTWPLLYNASFSSFHPLYDVSSSLFQPNVQSYNKVISAYARSGRPDAGILAEELLHRMLSSVQQQQQQQERFSTSSRAMPFPTAQTFTHVIEAYANSGTADAAPKAQQLCNQVEQMYLSSLGYELNHHQHLDTTHWKHESVVSLQHERNNQVVRLDDPQHLLRPTARLYNALINAWAKSEIEGAAPMAERCLNRMEEIQNMIGGDDLIPNTFHYNCVIHAWANSGQDVTLSDVDNEDESDDDDDTAEVATTNLIPADRAEDILKRMEESFQRGNVDARPNTISFNACIDAWAKSSHDKAGQRAEALLHRMQELYDSKANLYVKPNTRSFNSVMNAYSKSRDPTSARNAERIFDQMESLYKAGNLDVKPDFISFATVITAWAKSFSYGKADRVLNIFRHMNDLYMRGDLSVRPNVIIFNAVINACAYTMGDIPEQRRAIEIAQMMLLELEKSSFGKPDQVTYGTFLKVCQSQMPRSDSRRRIVDLVFKKCCKEGQVGKLVLTQLKTVANDEGHYRDLLGRSMDEEIHMEQVPREWNCNVIEGKRRRRQILHR